MTLPGHSGARPKARLRASATRYGREPGIHNHNPFDVALQRPTLPFGPMDSGLRPAAGPGMTAESPS